MKHLNHARLTLLSIPFSHYCEKARWALQRAGMPFVEKGRPPLFHYSLTARYKTRTVPVLVTPDGVLKDSTEILHWIDEHLSDDERLFPKDKSILEEVSSLENLFDEKLGPATRRFGYYYLMKSPALVHEQLALTFDGLEHLAYRVAAPFIVKAISRGLRIDAEGAKRSRERIEDIFTQIDNRLSDGRPYLVGTRFTAADLTFASLGAIVLAPEEYGAPFVPFQQLPAEFRDFVEHFRSRPSGQHALRMYREQRRLTSLKGF